MSKRALIVGAGFAGAVSAERLASKGYSVDVIEKRSHIAGNAFDETDASGLLIHRYGPHIFHTNSRKVFEYLSRFTEWRFYEHRVLADLGTKRVPIPINRTTLNTLYGLTLTEAEAAEYLESVREEKSEIKSSEDVVLNSVGSDLCDTFFRGYTRKQWGLDLSALSPGVASRIPTRTNDDDRYFTDTFQFMPNRGYTHMFARMLDHEQIKVSLNTVFTRSMAEGYDLVVYTGPIDEYFDCRFGKLPYRSLRFEHEHLANRDRFQEVGTVNYPNHHDYTRITEFKHLSGQSHPGTSIVREYPQADGDPYYPIPRPENEDLFKRYREIAANEENVIFIGRLAQYKYYNMDQVVGSALSKMEDVQ